MLASGTHRPNATIELTRADSGLTIVGAGHGVVVSGASVLRGAWERLRSVGNATAKLGLWRLSVPDYGPSPAVDTLYVDGVRAIQARYPNADPEHDRYPTGYIMQGSMAGDQWV